MTITIGDLIPDLTVATTKNDALTLRDLAGKFAAITTLLINKNFHLI